MKFHNTEAQPIILKEWLPSIISLSTVFFTGGFIFGLMLSSATMECELTPVPETQEVNS